MHTSQAISAHCTFIAAKISDNFKLQLRSNAILTYDFSFIANSGVSFQRVSNRTNLNGRLI